MLYRFLTDENIYASLPADYVAQLTEGNINFLRDAERAAIGLMKSGLNQNYVVDDVFPDIYDWSATRAYVIPTEQTVTVEGTDYTFTQPYSREPLGAVTNYAYHNAKFWKARRDNTNVEPVEGEDWTELDPREPLVVQYTVDVTIFYLFRRVAPRQIPDIRKQCYDEVKEWLRDIREDLINPDLPRLLPVDDSVDDIPYGNSADLQNYYY
ncbi:MAG: hypothetical protein AAFO91_20060 [Bacteroidota bacterium]